MMKFSFVNIRQTCLFGYALLLSGALLAQNKDVPMKQLLLEDLSNFKPTGSNWQIAGDANADLNQENALKTSKGKGVLVNLPDKKNTSNLTFGFDHADMDLTLDFMMAKGSNSGIYLQGRYELQLLDSWGKKNPSYGDCGGIYQRWDDSKPEGQKGYQGIPPRTNASLAPGLWQHLEVAFQAPRYDASGNKITNAKFLRVVLNGVVIHENVEVTGPTRGAEFPDEKNPGPILIQGDHGPVAFRNIYYKTYGMSIPTLSDLQYSYGKGPFSSDTLKADTKFKVVQSGKTQDLTIENVPAANDYIIRHTGKLNVKSAGKYTFYTQINGFNLLKIDGKTLAPLAMTGTWDERSATTDLSAGDHTFEVLVAKRDSWMKPALGVFIEGADVRRMPLNTLSSLPLDAPVNPILINVEGEPKIVRCFIDFEKGTKSKRITHAVSVGSLEGANFTVDLNNGALVQCWRGDFLNATPMWHDRGDGHSDPMGSTLKINDVPNFSVLPTNTTAWPDSLTPEANYRGRGYELDATGLPTFKYSIYGTEVEDMTRPEDGGKRLTRTLKVSGSATNLYCRIAEGKDIVAQPDGSYLIDDKSYFIKLTNPAGVKPVVRTVNNRQELLMPVTTGNQISYSIIW
ncbi:DUF1080 domain-containing protein [Cytophagaceae bacterium YF14B1]|uniref:DUF1080 domain-containing protein n=1 Tax=Xanthocytophaga flava TaxID=3048013 RepID=A0AAE3QPC2_9BACT|nr:family 16 glycoside hydrolase [Xanthocytophaga flavus]MDJ1480760.1 DUF1080 domain-containing protein [Xanthocytophaga flavus]